MDVHADIVSFRRSQYVVTQKGRHKELELEEAAKVKTNAPTEDTQMATAA